MLASLALAGMKTGFCSSSTFATPMRNSLAPTLTWRVVISIKLKWQGLQSRSKVQFHSMQLGRARQNATQAMQNRFDGGLIGHCTECTK